ncbi:hypothetical protein BGLA2_730025 [Burkholderia gladioli]|nr:hypothetical protein BGLA2_730025 [Burkholderia gladioli]
MTCFYYEIYEKLPLPISGNDWHGD